MSETVRLEILRRHLLRGVSRLGLAVSGGADSVALFHLLLPVCRDAGIAATVLHLNHGLRAEAEEDLRFVKELADSEGAPFFSESANLASLTRDGESLEMAARAARMDFFKRCRDATGLDAIATGHHADDVAETVLLRLARGAGAAGLSGLRPVSRLSSSLVLIRPLLSVSDSALRGWLTGNHQVWREDKTNRDEGIPRNFVRNTLLPHLEQTWVPDLRERLCQSAEALREDDALLEALAQRAREAISSGCTLSLAPLRGQPEALQRRILRQWLFQQNMAESAGLATVLTLLERCQSENDWRYQLPGGRFAVCRDGALCLAFPETPAPCEAVVSTPGTLMWGPLKIVTEASQGVSARADGIGRYPAECTLGAETLTGRALCVRSRRPGDRISPIGLSGSKKVQNLFVDEKVPEHLRDGIPIFFCGDEVVWVPGYRVARPFAVPSPAAPSIRVTVSRP